MGVPAFFRWLSKTYGNIVVHCNEEEAKEIDGVQVPVDATLPNPNEVEFDNLYLDMNGIIHPCCHPEDKEAPQSEDEMMVAIFAYIDRLLAIIRPRRLLYMAIDGVAPRAKMNQQRSRRFRASKESHETIEERERITKEIEDSGNYILPKKKESFHFDSNCITPGTEFMFRLADCLRYYITERLMNNPALKDVAIILSDANTPGEGEHKIMDYIRKQRANPDHDPNTHHCLCGADADLIMLGLATHEPHFTIIREEFKPNKDKTCDLCGSCAHEVKNCQGLSQPKEGSDDAKPLAPAVQFIFVRLNVLREYIELEMKLNELPFKYDFERIIDDWIFMCFFVGNDFLPHLPSLEIREGAIGRLIGLYKKTICQTKGYLTKDGIVNLERVQLIMNDLGQLEDEIFKKRRSTELSFRRRNSRRGRGRGRGGFTNFRKAGELDEQADKGQKRKIEEVDSDEEKDKMDEVRLWESGWRDRYYQNKFGVAPGDIKFRQKVAHAYVLGLTWVLRYYYQGCPSWNWYFPYHYAPFASDFVNISEVNTRFDPNTKPFNPLEQLMSVFPAASGGFLPETWRRNMSDIESPIIDFYPSNFCIDLNGKKYAWQGVALLPFVDEKRLLSTLAGVYPDLTDIEKKRNSNGPDRIFVGRNHPLYAFLKELYESDGLTSEEPDVEINPSLIHGTRGIIGKDEFLCPEGSMKTSPIEELPQLKNCMILSTTFRDPVYPPGHLFSCDLLPKAVFPAKTVKADDLNSRRGGRGGGYGGGGGGRGGGRGGSFHPRPQLGFTPRSGYRGGGFSTAPASRMITNSMQRYPPPRSYGSSSGYGNRGGRGGGGYRGGSRGNEDQSDNKRARSNQGGGYNNQGQSGYGGNYRDQSQSTYRSSYGQGGRGSQGGQGGRGGQGGQSGQGYMMPQQQQGYQQQYNRRDGQQRGGNAGKMHSYPPPPSSSHTRF